MEIEMDRYEGFAVIVGIVIIAAALAGWAWVDRLQCSAKWEHSGFGSRWGLLSGCLVETSPGAWVPADRVREITITEHAK